MSNTSNKFQDLESEIETFQERLSSKLAPYFQNWEDAGHDQRQLSIEVEMDEETLDELRRGEWTPSQPEDKDTYRTVLDKLQADEEDRESIWALVDIINDLERDLQKPTDEPAPPKPKTAKEAAPAWTTQGTETPSPLQTEALRPDQARKLILALPILVGIVMLAAVTRYFLFPFASAPTKADLAPLLVTGALKTRTPINTSTPDQVTTDTEPAAAVATEASEIPTHTTGVKLCRHGSLGEPCEIFTRADPKLSDNRIGNDTVSSIRVPDGYVATLYEDGLFRGQSETFCGPTDDLHLSDNEIGNDAVSSIRVSRERCSHGVAAPPTPTPTITLTPSNTPPPTNTFTPTSTPTPALTPTPIQTTQPDALLQEGQTWYGERFTLTASNFSVEEHGPGIVVDFTLTYLGNKRILFSGFRYNTDWKNFYIEFPNETRFLPLYIPNRNSNLDRCKRLHNNPNGRGTNNGYGWAKYIEPGQVLEWTWKFWEIEYSGHGSSYWCKNQAASPIPRDATYFTLHASIITDYKDEIVDAKWRHDIPR